MSPTITATDPVDRQTNVDVTSPIRVWFSAPMDRATVTWTIAPLLPLTPDWSPDSTLLTLNHTVPLSPMMMYNITVVGNDTDGHPLVPGPVPNPWSFYTTCAPCYIVSTDPADGDVNVPLDKDVTVVFSRPPEPSTLAVTVTPAITFMPAWPDVTTLVLSHTAPFQECTVYAITISVRELLPGPVPNPWSFSTASSRPCILRTSPADGERDVPTRPTITIVFSAPVGPMISLLPDMAPDPGPRSFLWSGTMDTLTIAFAQSLAFCTAYTVTVRDLFGPVPGLVPNPWTFTTRCDGPSAPAWLSAMGGYRLAVLTWSPPLDDGGHPVTGYRVYRGTSPGTETWRADVPATLLYGDAGLVNGQTYYYQVSAVTEVGEGPRSMEADATPRNWPPTVGILAPADGEHVSGIVMIQGNASDPDGTLANVEVRIDGGAWTPAQGSGTWTFEWNASLLPEGAHTIEARSFDGEDYSTEARITVVVDNQTPANPIEIPPAAWLALILVPAIAIPILVLVLLRRRRPAKEEGHPR